MVATASLVRYSKNIFLLRNTIPRIVYNKCLGGNNWRFPLMSLWRCSCSPLFSRYHAIFRQPLSRSMDRTKRTSCVASAITRSHSYRLQLVGPSVEQLCGLRDHLISFLQTSTCGAICRASFTPNDVALGTSCGMSRKRLERQMRQHAWRLSAHQKLLAQKGSVMRWL
jgi:hypothetical protein